MIVKAKGALRHCFHGEYSAVIGLEFADSVSADDALVTLQASTAGTRWSQSERNDKVLIWRGNSEELSQLKETFIERFGYRSVPCNSFGCKNAQHEIDSIAHSIDYGPPFNVEIPVECREQKRLF